MKNGGMINQPILFHKPNKKMKSEKKMDHFIPQTKYFIRRKENGVNTFCWVRVRDYMVAYPRACCSHVVPALIPGVAHKTDPIHNRW